MARNHAAKIRQGLNPKNGKATSSATERGAYGRTRPKADKSVRRAREVATDPRLQRARAEQERHEEALRALEEAWAATVVVELPTPAPGSFVPAVTVSRPGLGSPAMATTSSSPTRPTRSRRTAVPATSIRPEPEAWRIALGLAGGDARRLVVVDACTVLVRNRPAA